LLDYALYYLNIGWTVIPIHGKKPIFDQWQKEVSTEDKIRAWFGSKNSDYNIGIVTGKSSGIVVIDVDNDEGMQHLKQYIGTKPMAIVNTGGGGHHYYFKAPREDVPNKVRMLPGVDVRGESGMVVVPPSIHASGKQYTWAEGSVDLQNLPEMPRALLQLVTADSHKPLTGADWQTEVTEGNRDAEMTRRAGKLFRAGMPAEEIVDILNSWNASHCTPPLPLSQIKKIVASIAKRQVPEPELVSGQTPEEYFKVYNFEDTLKKYGLQETTWSIFGWLPEATCGLVVAPPANYKTWLLLDLAVSMATGKPFLGKYRVEKPGAVLLVQQEDPFPMLFSRIGVIMNIGEPTERGDEFIVPKAPSFPPIYWHTDKLLNFDNPKSVEGLRNAISTIRPKLIIIDPLYSTISSKDYMAEGAQSMLALKQIRDEFGCSFMIAHHTVKRGDAEGREGLWGSQFLNAWLESGWQIRPSKTDTNAIRIKRHFKSSAIPTTMKINFDINNWSFQAHTEEVPGDDEITLDYDDKPAPGTPKKPIGKTGAEIMRRAMGAPTARKNT